MRYAIAGSLLALSSLFVVAPLARGGCGPACCCPTPTGPKTPAARPRPAAELAAILDKTDDKDTFLITVMALRRMGPEAREALPSIIRNAERLGMVKGIAKALSRKARGEADTKVAAATEEVCEAILEIASATKGGKQGPTAPVAAYPPACCAPAAPVAPAVGPAATDTAPSAVSDAPAPALPGDAPGRSCPAAQPQPTRAILAPGQPSRGASVPSTVPQAPSAAR